MPMSQESFHAEDPPQFDTRRAAQLMERSRARVERQQERHLKVAALAGATLILLAFAGAAEKAGLRLPTRADRGDDRAVAAASDIELETSPAVVTEPQSAEAAAGGGDDPELYRPDLDDDAAMAALQAEMETLETMVHEDAGEELTIDDFPPLHVPTFEDE